MAFLDGVVIAVPETHRAAYKAEAERLAELFVEYGATEVVDAWGLDVPDGEVTSFPMAVARKEGEAVVLGWVSWPDKTIRDAAWSKIMEDPRMKDFPGDLFDGKRMIIGGFDVIQHTRKGG
ncbi:MAG: DUF1428 domain-containing protein [Rhodobacteraceae bacterium]|nr:DUF1428 domain-containing protein [Alphaproteobacteria bacterium]NNF71671.1 DUF1428 domain-containing protein [Paracoccaceae bacterium]NNK68654.1 DUF1428 domain-containing protein [Paracoccaceae bacterium]